jgi:hypothetical protein
MESNSRRALKMLLPASYQENDEILMLPTTNLSEILRRELSVKRLNRIQKYLWLAGRPMPPRPLNYQIAVSREIVVDERMDMHLVWEKPRRMHFKPIPGYLLNYTFWKEYLCCTEGLAKCREEYICQRLEIYRCAMGFLVSYAALIRYESDFQIAQKHHLLPTDVTWDEWVMFVEDLLRRTNFKNINSRYWYGELRLSRLNKIYAIRFGNLRGYKFSYQTYSELFHDYLAPVATATIYIALALTAMQVGLATDKLKSNSAFQSASYGFTIFSILAPLILLGLVFLIGLMIFIDNMRETLRFKKKRLTHLSLMTSGHIP